jgi:hypothetical protein
MNIIGILLGNKRKEGEKGRRGEREKGRKGYREKG